MKKKRSRSRKRRSRELRRIFSAVCIGVLIFGILYFLDTGRKYARDGEIEARLREIYYSGKNAAAAQMTDMITEQTAEPIAMLVDENPSEEADFPAEDHSGVPEVISVSEESDVPLEEPVLQPEFEPFYEANPDIVGWIHMGTSVDYPILWRDNTYYMNHDFDGNVSEAGAIFLDARNQPDMSDSAMLIYGHNMRNGSMFGDLDQYRGREYLRDYPVITIQSAWESEARKYVLISLFDASMNRSDPSYIKIIRTSFEQDEEKEAFIAEMCERSMFEIDLETTAEDQLLTLVTCSYTHDNGRFLLFARALREDETEEDILNAFEEMKLKK